jgi:tRNA(His) 5'-end guanylyltransferase
VVSDKNEIMFQLGVNYNNEPEMYKKGTVLYRNVSFIPFLFPSPSFPTHNHAI